MSRIILCFFSVLFFSVSYGALSDHLKEAKDKSFDHKMRNIDFIYMINLDRRTEKYEMSKNCLKKYGINPYRFSAVNGWELSLDAILDVGLKYKKGMTPLLASTFVEVDGVKIQSHEFMTKFGKTYFQHCMPLGAIGCSLSHISILQDAYDSGYETIWVMEDDIEVIKDPTILSDLIAEMDRVVGKGKWDVLFTDYDYRIGVNKYLPASGATKRPDMDCRHEERFSEKYTKTYRVNKNFRRIAARFGTHSMIIRRSGIVKLLEFSKKDGIYSPYDFENLLPKGIRRYGLNYDVVTNKLNSLSDIGRPAYLDDDKE